MHPTLAIDAAYKRGDLNALRKLLGNPPDFTNCRVAQVAGENVLEYAIYHSPLSFIRGLLELGADPGARTTIDECATPLEEAELLGRKKSAEFLRRAETEGPG